MGKPLPFFTAHHIHTSLGPHTSTTQMASRSVQSLFCTAHSRVSFGIPSMSFPLKLLLRMGGIETPSNTWFFEPTQAHNSNGILISSAVCAQLTAVLSGMPGTGMSFPLKIAPLRGRSLGSPQSTTQQHLEPVSYTHLTLPTILRV